MAGALILLCVVTLPLVHAATREGALLGRAYRAYREARFTEVRKLLGGAVPSQSPLPELAFYLRAVASAAEGDKARALDDFQASAQAAGASRPGPAARARIGELQLELGQPALAERTLSRLLAGPADGLDVAAARLSHGRALALLGKPREAQGELRRIVVEAPEHPTAATALVELTALGGSPLTVRERLDRADRLSSKFFHDEALAELSAAEGEIARAPELRPELDYLYGQAAYRSRKDYDLAARRFTQASRKLGTYRKQEALFLAARSLSRVDRDDEAIERYRALARAMPRAPRAPEALYLAAWLDWNRGRPKAAIPGFTAFLARFPRANQVDNARWFLAHSRLEAGDLRGADADLAKLAARGTGALARGKFLYWRGRIAQRRNDPTQAIQHFKTVTSDYPMTWYALLARERLSQLGIKVWATPGGGPPPTPPLVGTRARQTPAPPLPAGVTDDPRVRRALALAEAGLPGWAASELRGRAGAIESRHGLEGLLAVYEAVDEFRRPWQRSYSRPLVADLSRPAEGAARRSWGMAFPLAYRRFVEKYGPPAGNPDYLLYAIMQKESGYGPDVVSHANAIGLLQMIPKTSKKVSAVLGIRYADDLLFDPEGNVRLAAWYIGKIVHKFRGQLPLAMGAFNGGPHRMSRWVELRGQLPLDEFVERIPYAETREYVKKCVTIYARYLYLYDATVWQPTFTIDRRVRPEIDY